ncbi:MAG: 2-hydroxyacid dehydrogenase [Nitrososphaerales archaeon]
MFRVISLSPLPAAVVQSFFDSLGSKYGLDVEVTTINKFDLNLFATELPRADFILGDYSFTIPITKEMVDLMDKVKLIQQPSTGYDHIDVEACKKKGIPVANIGGANTISVAEYTITVALVLSKRIMYSHNKLLQGIWTQGELLNAQAELNEKNWGVIGLGRIGRAVASRAKALGANVSYYDLFQKTSEEEQKLGVSFRKLEDLLKESDVVSVHMALTHETTKLIGEKELRLMKPNAVLVNPSRGEIVDELALAKAVQDEWLAGAGVDVYTKEPPPETHPLIVAAKQGAPLVLTSHIAGANSETRKRIIQFTVENLVRSMLGQEPENIINS